MAAYGTFNQLKAYFNAQLLVLDQLEKQILELNGEVEALKKGKDLGPTVLITKEEYNKLLLHSTQLQNEKIKTEQAIRAHSIISDEYLALQSKYQEIVKSNQEILEGLKKINLKSTKVEDRIKGCIVKTEMLLKHRSQIQEDMSPPENEEYGPFLANHQ